MKPNIILAVFSVLSIIPTVFSVGGCEREADPTSAATNGVATTHDHNHEEGDSHDHGLSTHVATAAANPHEGHDHGDGHDHGETTQLGEQSAGGFTIKASRDGDIVAGKDAAIDVWVTATGGGSAKVVAVRFWIGTEDAKGSVKAKAERENENWHTHAEIPSPLATGSKLWVQVESEGGEMTLAGFDLNN